MQLLADQIEAKLRLNPDAYQAYIRGLIINRRDPLEEMRKRQRQLRTAARLMIVMHYRTGAFAWLRDKVPA